MSDTTHDTATGFARDPDGVTRANNARTFVASVSLIAALPYGWAPFRAWVLADLQSDHLGAFLVLGYGLGHVLRHRLLDFQTGYVRPARWIPLSPGCVPTVKPRTGGGSS